MKAVYLYGAIKVKGKFGEAASFAEAAEAAKKLGEGWFVIPANVTYDHGAMGGGYDAFFTRKAAGEGKARMYTIPWQSLKNEWSRCVLDGKPVEEAKDAPSRKKMTLYLASHPMVEEAWEDQGTTGILLMNKRPEGAPWGYMFKKNLGISFAKGGKSKKRMLQAVSRNYLGKYGVFLKKEDFYVIKGKEIEGRLDGGIVLPMKYKTFMMEDMKRRGVSSETLEKLKAVHVWNGRIFLPGGILDEAPHGALIKGQFYFSEDLEKITFHECNVKKELRVEEGQPTRIAMTPQEGKLRERDTDQFTICAPWLFETEDRKSRVSKAFAKFKENFASGKTELNLIEMEEKVSRGKLQEGSYVQANRLLGVALSAGLPKEWIPKGVWKEYLTGQGMKMLDLEKAKLRVPLEYATHCQVISHALMEIIKPGYLGDQGLGERIPSGFMIFDEEYKLFVVGDEDYEQNVQVTHGGSDLDDFYAQIFRKVGDWVYVFLFRSPCGWGEWSAWKFHGKLPKNWKTEKMPSVPETEIAVSTPRYKMPKVENGLLPGTKATWEKEYDYEEFVTQTNAAGDGAGGIVNLIAFFDLHRRYAAGKKEIQYDLSLPFSMEQVIDLCTQCDNPANLPKLQAFVARLRNKLREYVLKGGECDKAFTNGRKIRYALSEKREELELNLVDGEFTQVFDHAVKERKAYEEWVEKTTEECFLLPKVIVEDPQYREGYMAQAAINFEKGWRGRWKNGEEVSTGEGKRKTEAGLSRIMEDRKKYVSSFKPGIKEFIPHLVYWVYCSPHRAAMNWKDQKIMQDPLVFQAWVEWCQEHLKGLYEEGIQDHEWDAVEQDDGVMENIPLLPPKEKKLVLPGGTWAVVQDTGCTIEEDMEVSAWKWDKTRTFMTLCHDSLGEIYVQREEIVRITKGKGEYILVK